MGNNIVKESFGYSARLLDTFFNKNDFNKILNKFNKIKRNFGAI